MTEVEPDAPRDAAGERTGRVFTIGHSTRTFDEVMAMLRANGVDLLVDVRSFPGSRRFPQWNRDAIEAAMPDGIGYEWIDKIGGRRYTRVGVETVNTGWRVKAFRDYADYMATPSFVEGLERLLSLAGERTPAIMCSEAVPWRCHRRLITDALLVRGVPVYDIIDAHHTSRATMTGFASVDGGVITYPGDPRGAA